MVELISRLGSNWGKKKSSYSYQYTWLYSPQTFHGALVQRVHRLPAQVREVCVLQAQVREVCLLPRSQVLAASCPYTAPH